jgi:large subunit ribosomal protein L9
MAYSKILLLEQIENLGEEGDEVSVKAGYARNFLLPRGKAIPITHANKKRIDELQRQRDERRAKELGEARDLAGKIEATRPVVVVKTGEGGKMFGAVTARDLLEKLAENGVEVPKHALQLPQPVKELGSHEIEVKLHPEVSATLKFEIVSENPIDTAEDEEAAQPATSEA